jgi:tRNA A-37 threonylcarbamoyl transferase component Bud32
MRVKGLTVDQGAYLHSGVLHEISAPNCNFEVFDPAAAKDHTLDELTAQIEDIVLGGKSAISSEYQRDIARFQTHEVFPDKIVEEKRSAHGVSFGRFILRQMPGVPRDRRNKLSVAMKPFGSASHAARECAGYMMLAQHGIETFSPVGIFEAKDASSLVVITEKRNDFVSLDRDLWIEGLQVRTTQEVEILNRNTRTVNEISQLMAYIHAFGLFHPDGQIKNWAVDQAGTIGIIDTENFEELSLHHPNTAEMATADIEKLIKSLINSQRENKIYGVGLLSGLSDTTVRNYVEKNIVEPYVEVLIKMSLDETIDDEQAETLIDGVTTLFRREGQTWPNCLNADNQR